MIEPKRLIEAGGTESEARLLDAARGERPSPVLEARMRAALGLPFVMPTPASDFPPSAAPSPSGGEALGPNAGAASNVGSASSASASTASTAAATGTGFSWAKVVVGVALLGGFGAAAFSATRGDEPSSGVNVAGALRAPGEPGAPAAASPPPGAAQSSGAALASGARAASGAALPNDAVPGAAPTDGVGASSDFGSPSSASRAFAAGTATSQGEASAAASAPPRSGASASRGTSAQKSAGTAQGTTLGASEGADALRRASVSAGAPPDKPLSENTLNEEIRWVDSVRSALRAGDPALALSRAAAYRARFPQGTLRQEVEALRIEATRQAGDEKRAAALAERFASEHPTSPHLGRVRGAAPAPSASSAR